MRQSYPAELPARIVDGAIEYAEKKHRYHISRSLLTELYWLIRARRTQVALFRRHNPSIKVSTSFSVARNYVLDSHFPQRSPNDRLKRAAYACALGRIGSEFRKRQQPRLNLKRTELDRIMDHVTLEKDRRQYRLDI